MSLTLWSYFFATSEEKREGKTTLAMLSKVSSLITIGVLKIFRRIDHLSLGESLSACPILLWDRRVCVVRGLLTWKNSPIAHHHLFASAYNVHSSPHICEISMLTRRSRGENLSCWLSLTSRCSKKQLREREREDNNKIRETTRTLSQKQFCSPLVELILFSMKDVKICLQRRRHSARSQFHEPNKLLIIIFSLLTL